MKRTKIILIVLIGLLVVTNFYCTKIENWDNTFKFIAATDMRFYATPKYNSPKYFLGVLKAIKKAGKGSLMISPGDVDPPSETRRIISEVLGQDYPWYPTPGNHELDSPDYFQWLRQYNKDGNSLPNIVRKGPKGTEETTYSFDWEDCHFVALNQYYDGTSDVGTDGNVVPKLLDWLEEDLATTQKKYIFVFGHEPLVSLPDMDNGRIRHQGDSLDKYPKNAFRFYEILRKYGVNAYICGHTHSTSFGVINGLWQLDVGHSRGLEEDSVPEELFRMVSEAVSMGEKKNNSTDQVLNAYFDENTKQVKKTVYYLNPTLAESYKKIADEIARKKFFEFYHNYKQSGELKEQLDKTFWENSEYRKSSFLKFYVGTSKVKVEIYRDDARGGEYKLNRTFLLDKI